MDKLIVVNCAADTSMHPDVPQIFSDSEVLADSVEKAAKAGAVVAHIHAPPRTMRPGSLTRRRFGIVAT